MNLFISVILNTNKHVVTTLYLLGILVKFLLKAFHTILLIIHNLVGWLAGYSQNTCPFQEKGAMAIIITVAPYFFDILDSYDIS